MYQMLIKPAKNKTLNQWLRVLWIFFVHIIVLVIFTVTANVKAVEAGTYPDCPSVCYQHKMLYSLINATNQEQEERISKCICLPTEVFTKHWQAKEVESWARSFDNENRLPVTDVKLDGVVEVKPNQKLDDGLYIFVFRKKDNKLLIRKSDRPLDGGDYTKGNKKYAFTGNPGNADEKIMFVRHTQLNQGWDEVWSAGQMEVYKNEIIWLSNASGHYKPEIKSLNYVYDYLMNMNISMATLVQFRDHEGKYVSTKPKIEWQSLLPFRYPYSYGREVTIPIGTVTTATTQEAKEHKVPEGTKDEFRLRRLLTAPMEVRPKGAFNGTIKD